MNETPYAMIWSAARKNSAAKIAMTTTMAVETAVSRRLGHTTFAVSARTCWRKVKGLNLSAIKRSCMNGARTPEFARRAVRSSRDLATITARTLLDELAGVEKGERITGLRDVASLAVEAHRDVSIGFLICGSTPTLRMLQHAALAFPADTGVAAIVCDPAAEPGFRTIGGASIVTMGLLEDLRHILARSAQS